VVSLEPVLLAVRLASAVPLPLGTFVPLDDAELSPRFFARPLAFDCECPYCGRLLLVGSQRRDNKAFNRITGILTCTRNQSSTVGCGRRWIMGMIAWTLSHGVRPGRPPNYKPNETQLRELRQWGAGVRPKAPLRRKDPVNRIQALPMEVGTDD
jgi:hypothetical protein